MSKESARQNIQAMLVEELPNAICYFDEVHGFGYSLDPIDLKSKKGISNLDQISGIIGKSKLFFPQIADFKMVHFSQIKQQSIEFFHSFLGESSARTLQEIPIFLNPSLEVFDGGVEKSYDMQQKRITAKQIDLSIKNISYSAVSLCNQNASIQFTNITPPPGFHYHYLELLPILTELIAAEQFTTKLEDPALLKNALKIRLKDLKNNMESYNHIILTKARAKNMPDDVYLLLDYAFQLHYTNIISTILAFHLFELYHDHPEEIKSSLKDCFSHEKSLESFLQEWNVSLASQETVAATKKILQKTAF